MSGYGQQPSPEAEPARGAGAQELTELGVAFRRVFRSLSRLRGRDTHLGGSELSHAQFELLIELYERGELPAGELAAAARLTPATVTQMLDHLADCGHVERARSQTDRRVVVSRLTRQGRRKIEAKRAAWQSAGKQALEGVEDEGAACRHARARAPRRRVRGRPAAEACEAPRRPRVALWSRFGDRAGRARNPLL